MIVIPELSSLTSDDIALVTESAATSKSFRRLLDPVVPPVCSPFLTVSVVVAALEGCVEEPGVRGWLGLGLWLGLFLGEPWF